ncbi:MAG: phenylalanine--tRNA ligase subunit beta [Candidatus Uhrbacteria bacterium]
MDFKLSQEWLKEFVDVRLTPEEIVERLSLHSVSVERIRRLDDNFEKIVVGRIERIEPHPNADRLRIVHVATTERRGGATSPPGRPCRAAPTTRVVCGGTNLREGMLVAYATVGARVRWHAHPSSAKPVQISDWKFDRAKQNLGGHGEGDLVELKSAEIRGVRSDGMICAASEIGLGEWFVEGDHEILDLSFLLERRGGFYTLPQRADVKSAPTSVVGQPLAKALGFDNVVYEIEVTTNRPDLMSVQGLAREVAVIMNAERRTQNAELPKQPVSFAFRRSPFAIRVRIEDKKGCPRYSATLIDGVTIGPSPWWLQRRLIAAGIRPICNVVDATNYVMLETGQPLHAFDAAKLISAHPPKPPLPGGGGENKNFSPSNLSRTRDLASLEEGERKGVAIFVRRAKIGESIRALDGETYKLNDGVLVIADAERPIAIAGVIGGAESGVNAGTTSIVLECANFDPLIVRRGARALNIRTESFIRFDKGLPSESVDHVTGRAVALLTQIAGGRPMKSVTVGARPRPLRPIALDSAQTAARIGVAISPMAMRRTLAALGCRVRGNGKRFAVTPPWWRRGDLEQPHDLVEEIARIYGYHRLPSVLPTGQLPAAVLPVLPPRTAFDWEQIARGALVGCGGTEVVTYALASRAAIELCGYDVEQCVAIDNPLSDEFAYLRPSFLPTLLPVIVANQEHTSEETIFEMGNVYIPNLKSQISNLKSSRERDAGLPREEMRLAIVTSGRSSSDKQFAWLKGLVEQLFGRLGISKVDFRRSDGCAIGVAGTKSGGLATSGCIWHPGRTVDVVVGDILVGVLGELHPILVGAAKIDGRIAACELDWAPILAACGAAVAPSAPPQFPEVKRDIAFVVDRKIAYADVAALLTTLDSLLTSAELFDVYEGNGIPVGKKSMAFHLAYRASDRTLTADEVNKLHAKLIAALGQRFGAEMRE